MTGQPFPAPLNTWILLLTELVKNQSLIWPFPEIYNKQVAPVLDKFIFILRHPSTRNNFFVVPQALRPAKDQMHLAGQAICFCKLNSQSMTFTMLLWANCNVWHSLRQVLRNSHPDYWIQPVRFVRKRHDSHEPQRLQGLTSIFASCWQRSEPFTSLSTSPFNADGRKLFWTLC